MKRRLFVCFSTIGFVLLFAPAMHAENASLKNEVNAAIQKGLGFLKEKQLPTGAWGDPAVVGTQPALTALGVMCLMAAPDKDSSKEAQDKAISYLISMQKEDGGIYTDKTLATYNTSLALTALSIVPADAKIREVGLKARAFIVGLQGKFDAQAKPDPNSTFDSPYNGGIGYTSKSPYSDLSNTHFALEALYYSKNLMTDSAESSSKELKLDFDAAIKFVSRCQNLAATNDQAWVSEDPQNKGGFVYRPGESKTEPMTLPDGRTALRSYASMSYAGLLSFIYADMNPKDQRIVAVQNWLGKNYSVTENPGMGAQGLYYYYHTMAKALALTKTGTLTLADGKKVDWKQDLAKQLFNSQKADGSWTNDNGRWMEKDPVLSTAYAVLALGQLNASL